MKVSGEAGLVALARLDPGRYPFLLESVAAGPELARYDILFGFPQATLRLDKDRALSGPCADGHTGFLTALDAWWRRERAGAEPDGRTDGLPFTGGWFLYLGYELAAEVEPTLSLSDDPVLPVAFATRIPVAIVRDLQSGRTDVIAESGFEAEAEVARHDLAGMTAADPESLVSGGLSVRRVVEDDPQLFLAAVAAAKDYIAAGDVFQANLSRCWRAATDGMADPVDLYLRLRASNPAPFGGLIQGDGFALVSSSPERLIRRRGQRLDTRPIAGTRPRNAGDAAAERKRELLGHPKERAEHIMLIDLERNDLGRVCEGGSVRVDEYMSVESYAHVHHIVSNVTGTARNGVTPGELIRAVFPGGTITGCPKVRCMEIIHELEQRPRGAYTGSMGYLNRNGDCDLNILIRTMSVTPGQIEIAAGSGIVADSDPLYELDETRAKAKGLLLALEADS